MEILEDWKGPSPEQEIKGLKKLWDKSNFLKRKKEEFPLTKDLNLRREILESNLKTYVEKLYSVTQSICLPCEMNFECCNDDICYFIDLKLREQNLFYPKNNNPKGRFLSSNGCVIPSHLRPLCTFHICPKRELHPGKEDQKEELKSLKDNYFRDLNELKVIRYLLGQSPQEIVCDYVF